MTPGQKKNRLLNEIEVSPKIFSRLYKRLIDENEEDEKIFFLMDEMIDTDDTIRMADTYPRDSEVVVITPRGQKIKDAGGWLKVKYESMSEGDKIQRLLKYAIETYPDKFGWNTSELATAFEDTLNEYELQHLGQQLIDNGDAADCITKDGFEIGINEKSKAALYSKKYLKGNSSNPIPQPTIQIGTVQQVFGSTVHGGLTQSSDSSSNKLTSEPKQINKSPINIKRIIKYIFWILGAILTVYGIYEMLIKLKAIGESATPT